MSRSAGKATHTKPGKVRDYLQLIKPSLSIMVVFSSVICYLLAPKVVTTDWVMVFLIFMGGLLVTGSANAINQTVEKDTDAVMKRTANRPVAAGRVSQQDGWTFAIITGVAGVLILGLFFNWLSAGLAAFSLFLYAFIYTPLKKQSAIAVLVGAFPGALPCLIGWAAGNDGIFQTGHGWKDYGGWALFGIQFLWQFPHFWAIAWIAHADYTRAGFKLLPADKGPTRFTALQTIIYALLLLPVCILPFILGLCSYTGIKGSISLAVVVMANFFLIAQCVRLYRKMDVPSARKVMFGSYIYLPVILLAYLASKTEAPANWDMAVHQISSLF